MCSVDRGLDDPLAGLPLAPRLSFSSTFDSSRISVPRISTSAKSRVYIRCTPMCNQRRTAMIGFDLDQSSSPPRPPACGSASPSTARRGPPAPRQFSSSSIPARSSRVHTDSAEELLVIVQGTAEARIGDGAGRLETHQVGLVPPMAPHGLRRTSATTSPASARDVLPPRRWSRRSSARSRTDGPNMHRHRLPRPDRGVTSRRRCPPHREPGLQPPDRLAEHRRATREAVAHAGRIRARRRRVTP